jgi:hypothetical protein
LQIDVRLRCLFIYIPTAIPNTTEFCLPREVVLHQKNDYNDKKRKSERGTGSKRAHGKTDRFVLEVHRRHDNDRLAIEDVDHGKKIKDQLDRRGST